MVRPIVLLDSTLADGIRAEDVSLSPLDQVRVALRLDGLGVGLIEIDPNGGAARFLREAHRVVLQQARLLARIPLGGGRSRERELAWKRALRFGSGGIAFHCQRLPGSGELRRAIGEPLARGLLVLVRFEDWFRRYDENPARALEALEVAAAAGAHWIVARDSSGFSLPRDVARAAREARKIVGSRLGVGAANDGGLAVANVLEAAWQGAGLIEGCVNGYGPRCGLADLVPVAAHLSTDEKFEVLAEEKLRLLAPTARFVSELANQTPDRRAPFIGEAAFRCGPGQGGLDPRRWGARWRQPLEDGKGLSLLSDIARARGIRGAKASRMLAELRSLEAAGFRFEGAEASFELALQRLAGTFQPYFQVETYRCLLERHQGDRRAEATCVVRVGDVTEHSAADGDGPLHALDRALRKCLERFYPSIHDMRLHDYKVRLLPGNRGTAARTRVLVQLGDGRDRWGTSGVSEDVIDASFLALEDAVVWKLHKDGVPLHDPSQPSVT